MKRLWLLALVVVPIAVAFLFEPVRIWTRRLIYDSRESYSPRWVTWFARNQESNGSWDPRGAVMEGRTLGRPGVTGLALTPFLGAGYSHLSRDSYEGYDVGKSVKKALQWLIADQRSDGTFASSKGALDHVLATLALSEAYGMTGSQLLKVPAQKAVDALVPLHQESGDFDDPALQGWAALAFTSASWSELSFPRSSLDRLRSFFDARRSEPPTPFEVVSRIVADQSKGDPRIAQGCDLLLQNPPQWDQQDFQGWYWGSTALFFFDGPRGPKWKAWQGELHKSLLKNQRYRGDWPGGSPGETLIRTSLGTQSINIWYCYPNGYPVK